MAITAENTVLEVIEDALERGSNPWAALLATAPTR